MNIVFVGFATWGHRALNTLIASDHVVTAVVTQPPLDDSYYSYLNDDVAALASAHDIPVIEAKRIRPDDTHIVELIAAADLMLVSNWTSKIDRTVFDSPRLGTVNIHDSLLPQYAGFGAPNWALVNDEKVVGVTAHLMDDGFDTGHIVAQQRIDVTDDDTATTLVDRSLEAIEPVVVEALEARSSNRPTTPQDLAKASYYHRRRFPDFRIDWSQSARDIFNLVRAQSDPYPDAFSYRGRDRIGFVDVSVTSLAFGGNPGRVVRDDQGIVVVAGPGARAGTERGVRIHRVRTADGTIHSDPAAVMPPGTYLTARPGDNDDEFN